MAFFKDLAARHWTPLSGFARKTIIFLSSAVLILVVVLATQGEQNNTVSFDNQSGFVANAGGGISASPAPADTSSAVAGIAQTVVVQVVGQVERPGVYELPFGARVMDAIFAAGGLADGADQASVNLARTVNDGEQIQVLSLTQNQDVLGPGSSTASGSQRLVNLNLADLATLDSLPGIGPTLAQRIIDYRQANGGFRSISDLGKVAGIGQSLLGRLKNLVTI